MPSTPLKYLGIMPVSLAVSLSSLSLHISLLNGWTFCTKQVTKLFEWMGIFLPNILQMELNLKLESRYVLFRMKGHILFTSCLNRTLVSHNKCTSCYLHHCLIFLYSFSLSSMKSSCSLVSVNVVCPSFVRMGLFDTVWYGGTPVALTYCHEQACFSHVQSSLGDKQFNLLCFV